MGNFSQFYGFRSKFVYYEDLENTHKDIYDSLKEEGLESSNFHSQKMLNIANTMMNWASIEAKKEVQLLREYFGVSSLQLVEKELYNENFGRQLIDAINISLSFKEAYERHLTRITRGQVKITGASTFAYTFSDVLGTLISNKYNTIKDKTPDLSIEQLSNELFSDEIIQQALYQAIFDIMQKSGDWSGKDTNKGYQRLLKEINNFTNGGGILLQEISQIYKLDSLKLRLQEAITSTQQLKSLVHNGKSKTKMNTTIKTALDETTLAKGTLAEVFGKYGLEVAINEVSKKIPQSKSTNISRTGASGNKPDIVAIFDLDYSEILPVVDKWYENRTQAVNAQKALNQYLSKMKKGFIVYTNVKDYTLGKNFRGFSTGSKMSLESFEGVVANTPGGSRDLIGQIMSTMEGAILSDRKKELEEEICEKMAYFLFDDVLTIGKDTAASQHAIHLMLLDGVYIPLSYLFFLMARAIREAERDLKDIFSVTIYPGTIKYPNGPWEPGAWRDQKEEAYENIKIGAKFLKNFADMIREVKGT